MSIYTFEEYLESIGYDSPLTDEQREFEYENFLRFCEDNGYHPDPAMN